MKIFICILVLLQVAFAGAQQMELGKVSMGELEEKSHPANPDAEAAVLFSKGKTYMDYDEEDGFVLVTQTDVRIKIYRKEGYSWANKELPYFVGQSPKERVEITKAITYNLVNGSIEKTKLKSEGEFDQNVNKFYNVRKITMPSVREGCIVEYRTEIRSAYISDFPEWYFQSSIPVNYSEFTTVIPEYFSYGPTFRGSITPKISQSKEKKTHNFMSKERTGHYVSKTTFSNETVEYNETATKYVAENLPAMKDESYVSNITNYITSIGHELSLVKYPNAPMKSYSRSWDDIVKTIYNAEDFGGELKKSGYFEADLKALTEGLATPGEKAGAVFGFVKSRMNWNGLHGYYCSNGVKSAYKDKVGNVAEINLILTAMLRQCGLNANPALVSTRMNGISFFPNRRSFDYIVCAVETDGGVILLDATEKAALPNILPVRALNWMGRIVREDGTSRSVNLVPTTLSKDLVTVMATIDADGKISGKVRDLYFDYNALLYRKNYPGQSNESFLERLESKYSGIEITDHTAAVADMSKPVSENFSFTDGNGMEMIGDKMVFPPLLFFTTKENPFKQATREYPIDFGFPNQMKHAISLTIPDGYQIESMPQPTAIAMEDNICTFMFNISATGTQIQIVSTLDVNHAIVAPKDYETLKNFYHRVIEKQNEKIILKKI